MKSSPPMPKSFSAEVKDFINKLLVKDPLKRLGARGANEVKKHSFFKVCMTLRKKRIEIEMMSRMEIKKIEVGSFSLWIIYMIKMHEL